MKLKDDIGKCKIFNVFRRLYIIVTGVFLTLFFSVFTITGNLQNVIIALCFLILIATTKDKYFADGISSVRVSLIVFFAAFILRYSYCNFVNPFVGQVSDFKVVLEEAKSGIFIDNLNYYRSYLHKLPYPAILHFLNIRSQSVIFLTQCIIVSFCAVILYWTGAKIANQKTGILASIIYILWPAQIVYTQIITEEHMAALLTCLIIYMIICVASLISEVISLKETGSKKAVAQSCVIGCLCGLCACFKDWPSVIIVAIIICSIYLMFRYDKVQRTLLLICICCIVIFRTITVEGIIRLAEEKLQVNANNSVVIAQMYATLDPNSSGIYNPELNEEYRQILIDNDYDFQKANNIAMNILKEKIRKDYKKLPDLLLRKGKNAYLDDAQMINWAQKSVVSDAYREQFSWFYLLLRYVDSIYYSGVVLCVLLSAYFTRNKYNFFILLCILGGGMAGLLVEGQGRYKYSIEPVWCISAAYGICFLLELRMKMFLQKKIKKS